MSIFYRYFLREFIFTTALFFGVLLFLFTLILGTLSLKEILDLGPSILQVLKTYLFTALQLFSFLLPLSSFLSLLFSFQRMKEEGELLAFFSLGFTLRDLFKPFLVFAFFILALTFLSQAYLFSKAKRLQKLEQINLFKNLAQKEISPRIPISITEGLYLYVAEAEKRDSQNHLRGVILFEKKGTQRKGLYLAKSALLDLRDGSFSLEKGYVFYLENLRNSEILQFEKYLFKISSTTLKRENLYIKRGEMTLSELRAEISKMRPSQIRYFRYVSEYYQRLLYGFSVLPLLLQGFLLGTFLKTKSRLSLFFTGLIFYLFFYFLYNFFISLGESGRLFPLYAHLIFNFLFYGLLILEYRVFKNRRGFNL